MTDGQDLTAAALAGAAAAEGRKRRAVTLMLLVLALALQLAAPLLRDRVPLSDDLFIDSMIIPVWTAAQLALLALVLRIVRRAAQGWTSRRRVVLAVVAATVVGTLQPLFVAPLVAGIDALTRDPLALTLLWSVPAMLWLAPAVVLVAGWLRTDARRVAVPLAAALVVLGVSNFPFILWLTHLWAVYVNVASGAIPVR